MRFGVALPTCVEGMAYPIRFADHEAILRLAKEAERLGYDSVLANDHYSTMPYVRAGFDEPPRFYEPLMTLTYVASHTSRVELMTGVIVLPMREPVLLAKQVASLDHISGGRLTLGVGVGAYRAEFESVRPALRAARRRDLVDEGVLALRSLFDERRSTYTGRHVAFEDVELFPKPVQRPFPLLSCGNAPATVRRAAQLCAGWMPAGLPVDRLRAGVEQLHRHAEAAGRDPTTLSIAPQLVVCLDIDERRAAERFRSSRVHEHLVSLKNSTLRDLDIENYMSENLIGTPEQVGARIQALQGAGADHLAGLIVVANSEEEMTEQMQQFAQEVMPSLAGNR